MKIFGFTNTGYNGKITGIECDIRNGFPGFDIVGLPDTIIKESKERVRSAIRNSGFKFPQQRILVNLYPAGEHKSGALLDLGIALAILLSKYKNNKISVMTAGELTLEGMVVQAPQALGAINASQNKNCNLCLVPFETDRACKVSSLSEAYNLILDGIKNETTTNKTNLLPDNNVFFEDIYGLNEEKEILTIAAAGFHSIFLFGPPGVGKTLLCSRINRLLPKPNSNILEEITRIYGCAGLEVPQNPVLININSESTHLIFSGSSVPGEGALAHYGVLMLDEVNKISPKLLESVKTGYDKGSIGNFPSRFLMAANMNVCPCGGLGKPNGICYCSNNKIENYWKKPSTAFLERFDIRIPVKAVNIFSQKNKNHKESYYLEKIKIAHQRQKERYKYFNNVNYNGQIHLNPAAVKLISDSSDEIKKYIQTINSSPRLIIGTIALARTIADFSDRDKITEEDLKYACELRKYGFGDYYWKTLI